MPTEKKWYNLFVSVDETPSTPSTPATGPAPASAPSAAQAVAEIAASLQTQPPARAQQMAAKVANPLSFQEIYEAAEIPAPASGYTVYKVADMLMNPHIKDLPADVKRSSVLVALDAAGVKIDQIIEDAIRSSKWCSPRAERGCIWRQ